MSSGSGRALFDSQMSGEGSDEWGSQNYRGQDSSVTELSGDEEGGPSQHEDEDEYEDDGRETLALFGGRHSRPCVDGLKETHRIESARF